MRWQRKINVDGQITASDGARVLDVAVVRICSFALRFPLLALKGWEALLIVGHSRYLS